MHYFIHICLVQRMVSLLGTGWLDPISSLIYSRAWFCWWCFNEVCACLFQAKRVVALGGTQSTFWGSSLCLEIWIITAINSAEVLLAIFRECQLMILFCSEVIENDHFISHTGWELKPFIITGSSVCWVIVSLRSLLLIF